jgi:DNA helicase II / ATP-dependent DNA helicase PcrA
MSNLLNGLNDRQKKAVTAGNGPVLVLAGPGSGKTRVLTHRIAYLIHEMNVSPHSIMAVTFTNKAAGEMRERINRLLGQQMRGLQVGTFHATCARLLRREGERTPFGPDYVIYDTADQATVVKQAMAELQIDPKRYNPKRLLSAISRAKNELLGPDDLPSDDYFSELVARVYPRYQAMMLDNNALDFDDLLMQMVILLRNDPVILQKYQHSFEYVLVDEFQDTNTAQYKLVELLAAPQNNVFVVGDEDQSIYAFRGADFRNVLRFRDSYQTPLVVVLEQNYRSTQIVLDVARSVIEKNTNRTPKALFTTREGGEKVQVQESYDAEFEARYMVENVETLMKDEERQFSDFAVMYRTNAQSRALEEACVREGIPYKLIGGVGFYQRREIRDLLAYLRVINNSNDKISFSRVINTPRRGIGKKSFSDFQYWAAHNCDGYTDALNKLIAGEPNTLSNRTAKQFVKFGQQLQQWQQKAQQGKLLELLDTILTETNFAQYIKTISDNDDQAIDRDENIQELRGIIARGQDEEATLAEFLAEQSLMTDLDSLEEGADAVTLLTLHAAKGLEYPVIFITGLEEGLLPHVRSYDDPEGMSEERRLFYVGITRAKDRLFLTHAFRRTMYGSADTKLPSRFLGDLPPDLVEGLSPRTRLEAEIREIQQQTTWELPSRSVAPQTPPPVSQNSALKERLRAKIVPFPGAKPALQPARFQSNDRVTHASFGEGTVIESKMQGGIEFVTVVFSGKTKGIKKFEADMLKPLEK